MEIHKKVAHVFSRSINNILDTYLFIKDFNELIYNLYKHLRNTFLCILYLKLYL